MFDRASYVEARCTPEPNSGCWLWLLSTGSHGYGQASGPEYVSAKNPAGVTTAHRVTNAENSKRHAVAIGRDRQDNETSEEKRLRTNAYKARWAREKRAKAAA